eukprot:scaffold8736_cov114-Isochrysis_galbana.AAC.1
MAVQVGHFLHAGSMLGRCYHAARLGASGVRDVAAGDLLRRKNASTRDGATTRRPPRPPCILLLRATCETRRVGGQHVGAGQLMIGSCRWH